ncbi:MAG: hypothetical protein ACLFVJ_00540 [Persicimonas sp.]
MEFEEHLGAGGMMQLPAAGIASRADQRIAQLVSLEGPLLLIDGD